jgi:hypothetical protein
MKDQHALGPDERVHVLLTAERAARSRPDLVPMLAPPVLRATSLEQAGIRSLGEGSLTAERPVLVSAKMVQEVLHWTADAGAAEIGGATLGQLIVLPQPLPGTRTRVVTVLSACVRDHRHAGEVGLFTFSPEALDEATRIAELRGLGETVITAFHSHGWGSRCGNCNQNPRCPLPDATQLSLRDYELAESLFPSKATLLPVAGRQLGAPGQRPVLTIHGWNGGRMTPFRWQQYHE